jgi:hypothetical protein
VSELALDDDQRHAFTGHLDRVCVPQLVGREASADAGPRGGASELGPGPTGGPGRPRVRPLMTQSSGPIGSATRAISHGSSSCQPQSSIPTSRRRPPFPRRTSSEPRRRSRSASRSESASSILSPARHHTTTSPRSRRPWTPSPAIDRDDLLDGRRVGRIPQALVARRTTGVKAGHRRRRPARRPAGSRNSDPVTSSTPGYDRKRTMSPQREARRAARALATPA